MLRMGEFLEPALFRAAAGAPTLSRELKLHLVRSEEAREDDAKLPAEEDIVVQVKIALNDEVYGQFAVAAEDAPQIVDRGMEGGARASCGSSGTCTTARELRPRSSLCSPRVGTATRRA